MNVWTDAFGKARRANDPDVEPPPAPTSPTLADLLGPEPPVFGRYGINQQYDVRRHEARGMRQAGERKVLWDRLDWYGLGSNQTVVLLAALAYRRVGIDAALRFVEAIAEMRGEDHD